MRKHIPWLAAAAILVIIFGTTYGVVQQSQRNDANFPQIQLAEDAANELNQGAKAQVPGRVDMAHSLSPFIIVYDLQGSVVSGSGYLNGQVASAPIGILAAAKDQTYHAVTWQPQKGVRVAAITVKANNYYVLSGRSLTEVEKNEQQSLQLAMLGGFLSWLVLGVAYLLSRPKASKE